MSKELVKQTLDELAGKQIPANPDLWPAIKARLQANSFQTSAEEVPQSSGFIAGSNKADTDTSKTIFSRNNHSPAGPTLKKVRFSLPKLVIAAMLLVVIGVTMFLLLALVNSNNLTQENSQVVSTSRLEAAATLTADSSTTPVMNDAIQPDLDTIQKECEQLKLGDFDCLMKINQAVKYPLSWLPLSQELNLSQTNNGFKMNIRRVYADVNSILIGYEVIGPEGVRFNMGQPGLTDDQGNPLKPGGSASTGLGYNNTQFVSFDGSTINGNPKSIKVRLVSSKITIRGNPPTQTPESRPTPTLSLTPQVGSGVASTVDPNSLVNVPASFSFEFEIPFQGGQVVEVNQTARTGNRELTLERAIVAPSGTSFYLSGLNKDRLMVNAQLTAGGKTSQNAAGSPRSEIAQTLTWFDNFTALRGSEWTLVVNEIGAEGQTCTWEGGYQCRRPSPGTGTPKQFNSGGPWTFRFTP